MSDFSEWVAFAGMASNQAYSTEERLGLAVRAIELLEKALEEARAKTVQVTTGVSKDAPLAWKDLIEGLIMLSRSQSNGISPLHCEHDTLTVCANPSEFTKEELVKIDELGFFVDEDGDCFKSYRFGSA